MSRTPAKSKGPPPDPEELLKKLAEVEKARKDEEKQKKKEKENNEKAAKTATKMIAKEITAAQKALTKKKQEVAKLEQQRKQLHAKSEQARKKAHDQHEKAETTDRKLTDTSEGLRDSIQSKNTELAEAKGSVQHLENIKRMIDATPGFASRVSRGEVPLYPSIGPVPDAGQQPISPVGQQPSSPGGDRLLQSTSNLESTGMLETQLESRGSMNNSQAGSVVGNSRSSSRGRGYFANDGSADPDDGAQTPGESVSAVNEDLRNENERLFSENEALRKRLEDAERKADDAVLAAERATAEAVRHDHLAWFARVCLGADVLGELRAAGADVETSDDAGRTPLHVVASYGRMQAMSDILEAGADTEVRCADGSTPLILAAYFGQEPAVSALLAAQADVAAVDDEGRSALWYAAQEQHATVRAVLVAAGAFPEDDDDGARSAWQGLEKRVARHAGGRGDVTVSLMWHTDDDLDLQVVAPSGEKIYYSRPTSRCRGTLDVTMNESPPYSTQPVENVVWPIGCAPTGTYEAHVQLYARRSSQRGQPIPYMVSITASGQKQEIVHEVNDDIFERPTVRTGVFTHDPRLKEDPSLGSAWLLPTPDRPTAGSFSPRVGRSRSVGAGVWQSQEEATHEAVPAPPNPTAVHEAEIGGFQARGSMGDSRLADLPLPWEAEIATEATVQSLIQTLQPDDIGRDMYCAAAKVPSSGPSQTLTSFELFFSVPFSNINQELFKRDLMAGLRRLGAPEATLAEITIQLRAGSTIAVISGPTSAIAQLDGLELERLSIAGFPAERAASYRQKTRELDAFSAPDRTFPNSFTEPLAFSQPAMLSSSVQTSKAVLEASVFQQRQVSAPGSGRFGGDGRFAAGPTACVQVSSPRSTTPRGVRPARLGLATYAGQAASTMNTTAGSTSGMCPASMSVSPQPVQPVQQAPRYVMRGADGSQAGLQSPSYQPMLSPVKMAPSVMTSAPQLWPATKQLAMPAPALGRMQYSPRPEAAALGPSSTPVSPTYAAPAYAATTYAAPTYAGGSADRSKNAPAGSGIRGFSADPAMSRRTGALLSPRTVATSPLQAGYPTRTTSSAMYSPDTQGDGGYQVRYGTPTSDRYPQLTSAAPAAQPYARGSTTPARRTSAGNTAPREPLAGGGHSRISMLEANNAKMREQVAELIAARTGPSSCGAEPASASMEPSSTREKPSLASAVHKLTAKALREYKEAHRNSLEMPPLD